MDTETGFGLSTIGQIAIAVKNLDEQTAFYGDKLGMKLLFRVPNMTFFDGGGVRLMLNVPESAEFDHPASIIYFKVADIHEAYEVLCSYFRHSYNQSAIDCRNAVWVHKVRVS